MSVAASHIPADLPQEPFGQTGIRQYAGRILAWLCLTVGLCAAAMGHRSGRFSDEVTWTGRGQKLEINSTGGQLLVIGSTRQNATGEGSGWAIGGSYHRRPIDMSSVWRTDLGDAIGFEGQIGPPYPSADNGFYFRAQWGSIAMLFLIWPLVYGVRKVIRLVRPRAD